MDAGSVPLGLLTSDSTFLLSLLTSTRMYYSFTNVGGEIRITWAANTVR